MLLCAVDTETTGLKFGDHRFVEVYAGLYDLETQIKVDEFFTRINPERSIPAETTRIHGITFADVADKPIWKDVAGDFRAMIERADVIIWHNGQEFDGPFINYELARIGLPALTKPGFDTMLNGRGATPMGTIPTLGALCWAYDVPYDTSKAHAADYDCEVMMDCVFKGIAWGHFKLPDLKTLSEAA